MPQKTFALRKTVTVVADPTAAAISGEQLRCVSHCTAGHTGSFLLSVPFLWNTGEYFGLDFLQTLLVRSTQKVGGWHKNRHGLGEGRTHTTEGPTAFLGYFLLCFCFGVPHITYLPGLIKLLFMLFLFPVHVIHPVRTPGRRVLMTP